MTVQQRVITSLVMLSAILSLSSCDLFGFGKESLLEPEAFPPFAIESDWFAIKSKLSGDSMEISVIDIEKDCIAGSIHFKCTRGWGVPAIPQVIKDRIYVCSAGMPGENPPKEIWSITPSTGASRRIALPYYLAQDPVYLPTTNRVVVCYSVDPSPLTVIDFDTDTVTQNSPKVDAIESIFEASDGTVYGVSNTYIDPTFARLTFDPFTITGLTPARSQANSRLPGKAAIELPNGNIVINDAHADTPHIVVYSPSEGRVVNAKNFDYTGQPVHSNNQYPFSLQMYNNGNVLLVGHGLGQENLWEAAISIHDPETLEIKGWITGEFITNTFYVRRDKMYCVGNSHIYVRDLKSAGYPLIKTINLK